MVHQEATFSYPCFLSSERTYQFHRKASKGRLTCRYEDNIKIGVIRMDMKDVNWIEVTRDRISHKALALGALNNFNKRKAAWLAAVPGEVYKLSAHIKQKHVAARFVWTIRRFNNRILKLS